MNFFRNHCRGVLIFFVAFFVLGWIKKLWTTAWKPDLTNNTRNTSTINAEKTSSLTKAASMVVEQHSMLVPVLGHLFNITDQAASILALTPNQLVLCNDSLARFNAKVVEVRRRTVVAMAEGNQSEKYRIGAFPIEANKFRKELVGDLMGVLETPQAQVAQQMLEGDEQLINVGAHEIRLTFRPDPSQLQRKTCYLEEINRSGDRLKSQQLSLEEVNQSLGLQFQIGN
jgi:hypothetical protein